MLRCHDKTPAMSRRDKQPGSLAVTSHCNLVLGNLVLGNLVLAILAAIITFSGLGAGLAPAAYAQDAPGWQADIDVKKNSQGPAAKQAKPAKVPNTTVIERGGDVAGSAQLKLIAFLTADGQQIDQGLIWRIYLSSGSSEAKSKLVAENREPSPVVKLPPGDYTVNAAFGRANLTRKVSVKSGTTATERFVINAGGLRLTASVAGKPVPDGSVTYAIYSDDRDQFANRTAVMTGAKPGLIIRLNAGIYHLVSTYGDANAKIEADVTVEAGKLTEATVVHQVSKAAFKLVARAGGEALPDTHWTIQSQNGEIVKESVGALPAHVLAPGSYIVLAKAAGRTFQRGFALKDGETVNVEVLVDSSTAIDKTSGTAAAPDPAAVRAPGAEEDLPLPDLKNP